MKFENRTSGKSNKKREEHKGFLFPNKLGSQAKPDETMGTRLFVEMSLLCIVFGLRCHYRAYFKAEMSLLCIPKKLRCHYRAYPWKKRYNSSKSEGKPSIFLKIKVRRKFKKELTTHFILFQSTSDCSFGATKYTSNFPVGLSLLLHRLNLFQINLLCRTSFWIAERDF